MGVFRYVLGNSWVNLAYPQLTLRTSEFSVRILVVGGFQRGLPRCYEVLCRPEINRIISLTERFHPLLSRVRFEKTIRCQSAKLVTAQVLFTRDVNPWPDDSWVRIPPPAPNSLVRQLNHDIHSRREDRRRGEVQSLLCKPL